MPIQFPKRTDKGSVFDFLTKYWLFTGQAQLRSDTGFLVAGMNRWYHAMIMHRY